MRNIYLFLIDCYCHVQYLVLVNSSVNFLVYTMLASQFQTVFMEMFGMGFRAKVQYINPISDGLHGSVWRGLQSKGTV
jgi:hypothetical protein